MIIRVSEFLHFSQDRSPYCVICIFLLVSAMSVVLERTETYMKFESVQRWLNYVAAERFGERSNTNEGYLRSLEEFSILARALNCFG